MAPAGHLAPSSGISLGPRPARPATRLGPVSDASATGQGAQAAHPGHGQSEAWQPVAGAGPAKCIVSEVPALVLPVSKDRADTLPCALERPRQLS